MKGGKEEVRREYIEDEGNKRRNKTSKMSENTRMKHFFSADTINF